MALALSDLPLGEGSFGDRALAGHRRRDGPGVRLPESSQASTFTPAWVQISGLKV